MKNLFLAVIAAISLAGAIAPAANAAVFHHSTVAEDAAATRMVQTGSYY
jgi:acid phosphatase class B